MDIDDEKRAKIVEELEAMGIEALYAKPWEERSPEEKLKSALPGVARGLSQGNRDKVEIQELKHLMYPVKGKLKKRIRELEMRCYKLELFTEQTAYELYYVVQAFEEYLTTKIQPKVSIKVRKPNVNI